tara:strand:+ start:278 stop:538 length:261 start_codon:yes stop_codon:yes gene_type:complete
MELRKELRDFINWQRHLNLLKDPLTIDYELAETYLESKEKQFSLQGVSHRREPLIAFAEDWNTKNDTDQVEITEDDIDDYLAINCG